MPLALTDHRWTELQSSYGSAADVITWLTEAEQGGAFPNELLGNIINEVQHQGGTSTAMYAVAPHLISFARKATPETALHLLTHAGLIYANSDSPGAVPCPDFLQQEFSALVTDGAQMLSRLLPSAKNFDDFKWAVAGLAGFVGQHQFARFLDGLELHEGKFYHELLDEPLPPER